MNESATIEEEVTRIVADVDWTDECQVLLHLRKRTMRLTPAQARQIATALTRSAEAADKAAASAVRPVAASAVDLVEHMSPDCKAGKHPHGWQDAAWDDAADAEVPCECPCHADGAAA